MVISTPHWKWEADRAAELEFLQISHYLLFCSGEAGQSTVARGDTSRQHMKEDDRRTQTAPRPTTDLGQPVWVSSGLLVPQDVLTNCFHTGSYRLISFWWGVAQLPLILLHMYTFTSSYLKKIFLKVQFKWKQSNNCKADLITSKGQGTWMTITDNSKCTHRLILLTSKEATI